MTDALFTAADVYDGDPVDPDLDTPTPDSIVAGLSREDRVERVHNLVSQAYDIIDRALEAHVNGREVVGFWILYSGGNDSTTLAHMFRHYANGAIHCNTTIGIEQTRQFVRDTCAGWGLPLIEKVAPETFRELVLGRWGGFPGPALHYLAYQRLKERQLDAARHDIGVANSRTRVAVYLGGRRRAESARRAEVPLHEADGSVIWASPLAMWTKLDLNTYRTIHPDVPRNPASDLIHMSGECLCGAFAHDGEREEIREWFPDVIDEIEAIEAEARAAGIPEPFCRWGHGQGKPSEVGRACGNCLVRGQMTFGEDA